MSINPLRKFKDHQIISRLKNRDRQAFIDVYDQNVQEINRFIYFKIGNREEANDLTSMIFLKAWNHIQKKTLEDAKTLRALLYKIARTSIIDYYRDTGSKVKATLSLDNEDYKINISDKSLSTPERLDTEANLKLIKSKLPLLKEEYREVIIMRFINDLSLGEIADISGKTRGNLRVLVHRALNALRELIEQDELKKNKLKENNELKKNKLKENNEFKQNKLTENNEV